jgi:type IV secretion system protein VirB1
MMFIDFDSTAAQCAPSVAPATLRAIAYVESGFNPYAIGVVGNRLQRQPKNLPEAMSMIQIYVGNWPAYNLNTETAFDPCANMRAAAGILGNCYARAKSKQPDSQVALKQALSCYYSNNFVTGFQHGYVQKVVAAAQRFGAQAPKPTLVAAATSI